MGSSVRHGRRKGSAGLTPANETIFKLALNPPDDPESFKMPFHTVASEYATRYLEQIGVKPSKATMDMVHKNIPLTDNCVKTTFRAKGHVTDEVQVTVPPVQHKFHMPQVISAHSMAQLGYNNHEHGTEEQAAQPDQKPLVSGLPLDEQTGPGLAFKRLASRYLHPFNLDINLAKQNVERIRAMVRNQLAHSHGPAQSDDEEEHTQEEDAIAQAMREELAEELVVTPEVVLTVLSPLEAALVDWHKAQAPETLKDRLSKEDFQATVDLLSEDWSVSFFTTVINFLYAEFIQSSPHYEASKELQKALQQNGSFSRSAIGSRRNRRPGTAIASKTVAMQQHDMGYKLFVEEKMEGLKLAASQRKERPNTSMLLQASLLRPPLPSAAVSLKSMFIHSRFSSIEHRDGYETPPSPSSSHKSSLFFATAPQTPRTEASDAAPLLSTVASHRTAASTLFFNTTSMERERQPPQRLESKGKVMFDLKSQGASTAVTIDDALTHTVSNSAVGSDAGDGGGSQLASRRSMRLLPSAATLTANSAVRSILDTLDSSDWDKVQQHRLFAIQKEFAGLYKKQRQERAGMFFRMPILLLFLRLAVSMLFSSLYPLWCKTVDGIKALEKMDAAIVHLFDPHGYLQRNLSILQSSPAAVSILSKYPHKGHEPEHIHFSDISPLMRAAMSESGSVEARKLMHHAKKAQGSAPFKTQLTKAQMEVLYQDVRSMMTTKNTNLGKKGEPVQPTARDSWIPKPDVVR